MQQDTPSKTAWAVALRRAAHQLLDRPLVLEDPLAVRIVGQEHAEAAADKSDAGILSNKYSRVMRAVMVGRSRYAEDCLAQAVTAGVRQYVVLGAGLDTFAYRNAHSGDGLRVFEVDHPATQSRKRELLAAAGIAPPESLTFVPVNFESQTLAGALPAAGFDPAAPAFFSWLGVVPYLTLAAFRQTLAFLGQRPAGSHVVLDYAIDVESLGIRERIAFNMLAARVKAAGEPLQLFLPVEAMHAELRLAGFTEVEDLDGSAINARYFHERSDGLAVAGKLGHFLHARK
jgi:methyltransferase (TIGR00027 family)